MNYCKRAITTEILTTLQHQTAIFINGARQAGKSTLAQAIAGESLNAEYFSFDELSTLAAATADPENFINKFDRSVIIDEIQMVPQIFRSLKKRIDELRQQNNDNIKFILTGSTNVLALPKLAAALVGRVQVATLYPIAAGEYLKKTSYNFIENLFTQKFTNAVNPFAPYNLATIISNCTYPEIAFNLNINRQHWFESYITTLLQRDFRTIAAIENLIALPRMLRFLAARATGLINDASLARDIGLNAVTYKRYRTMLHLLFLLLHVEPWQRDVAKRLVKAPKLFFADTALLCHLLNVEIDDVQKNNPDIFGRVLENFVASELTKQLTLQSGYSLYHFRTHDNREVDFVIEKHNGELVGIEVKASTTLHFSDFNGLRTLQELTKDNFCQGVILYQGRDIISFGEKLTALPIAALWEI